MHKREIKRFTRDEDDKIIAVFSKQKDNSKKALDILEKKLHKSHSRRAIHERYKCFLSKNRNDWTEDEDKLILDSYKMYGNKWSLISKLLKNRSGDQVKIRHKQLSRKNDTSLQLEGPTTENKPNSQKEQNEDFWTNELTNFDIDDDQIELLFI